MSEPRELIVYLLEEVRRVELANIQIQEGLRVAGLLSFGDVLQGYVQGMHRMVAVVATFHGISMDDLDKMNDELKTDETQH